MTTTTTVLYNFNGGSSGRAADAGLTMDSNGNLFGVELLGGGANNAGTIYEIANTGTLDAPIYATTETVLVTFNPSVDGEQPSAALYVDAHGDLFGTTRLGSGSTVDGTVFELANTGTVSAPVYASTPTNLVDFNGTDGLNPYSALIADSKGDLFGTTKSGGSSSDGVAFELVNTGTLSAPSYSSTPTTLFSFNGTNGANPYAGLYMDSSGNLFGTTFAGGAHSDGTVFELVNNGTAASPVYASAPTVLVSFNGTDGKEPHSSLVADAAGDLFGTTYTGGSSNLGEVYEIVNTGTVSAPSYSNTPTVLASFNSADGQGVYGGVIIDAQGNLFGATYSGNTTIPAVVYEIANTGTVSSPIYSSTPTILSDLTSTTGQADNGNLIADAAGNLLAVTYVGGTNNFGTVLELSGTGYVACYAAGTRIATPAGEVAVEKLAVGDLVVTASGAARPIKWLGHRTVDCSHHPEPHNVWPVRVLAGAFGDNRPSRDLWLSPGHNVDIGGALAPIRALLNGKTVVQVERATVEYWHVELDRHDILLAEGLPAESYLDTGNRNAFVEGGDFIEAHPNFEPRHRSETCLPLVQKGPEIERIRALLLERIGDAGFVTDDADLHVVADGQRIKPIKFGAWRFAFTLPEGCADIVLTSRAFVPAEMIAGRRDTRRLGVCVGRLQLDGEDIALADAAHFAVGWHDLAPRGHRWTTGRTPLPAGTRLVVVDLAGDGSYWLERKDNVVAMFG